VDRRHWSNVSHEIQHKPNVWTGKCKGIKIDTANGSTSMVMHIGNYKGKVQCADGTESVIIMKNVKVVPGLVKNLFSL